MEKIIEKRRVGSVYGIIKRAYALRAVNKLLYNYLVKQVKLATGLTCAETVPIREVVDMMQKNKSGCVVIKKGKQITGIFTERDLMNKIVGESVDWNQPIGQYATREPVTMKESEPLRKALFFMRKKNFRHIPIFDDGDQLVGVLSVRNIIKLLAEHFPQEVMNLPPRLHSNPDSAEGG